MKHNPRFNIIIATDIHGGFSYKNKLPWKFVKDSNFYNIITGSNINLNPNILIMGRKTWESMGSSVPKNRIAFVVTSDFEKYNKTYEEKYANSSGQNGVNSIKRNLFFFPTFSDALSETSNYDKSIVWVVGGYQIYDEALRHSNCASIYFTEINGEFKTDRIIDLKTYNINWSNAHTEVDVNCYDELNYILCFKKGFIARH